VGPFGRRAQGGGRVVAAVVATGVTGGMAGGGGREGSAGGGRVLVGGFRARDRGRGGGQVGGRERGRIEGVRALDSVAGGRREGVGRVGRVGRGRKGVGGRPGIFVLLLRLGLGGRRDRGVGRRRVPLRVVVGMCLLRGPVSASQVGRWGREGRAPGRGRGGGRWVAREGGSRPGGEGGRGGGRGRGLGVVCLRPLLRLLSRLFPLCRTFFQRALAQAFLPVLLVLLPRRGQRSDRGLEGGKEGDRLRYGG
jgi:hypothetical protein